MILQGRLWQDFLWVTEQDKGDLLCPTYMDENTGKMVEYVLILKYTTPM